MGTIDLNKLNNIPIQEPLKMQQNKFGDFFSKDIQLFGKRLNDKKKERFYSELCILFSAGVDIRAALELIEEEQSKEKDKLVFSKIKEQVISGSSFSAAIENSGLFSSYEYYSIQIGEESGRLKEVLQELANYFANKIVQKRLLVGALSYPSVVFCVAFGAVYFMMRVLVPMFLQVFKRFKGELPPITKFIIKCSNAFTNYSGYFFIFLILVGIFVYVQYRKTWFRKLGSRLILRLPVIKNLISKIYLARFCQSMNLLISSKTPLLTSIDLVERMVGFYPIESSLSTVKEDIKRGIPLSISLSKFKIYSKRMTSLIKVAEEVNQLDLMFDKLAKQYTNEVEHQTKVFGSLIEPILIIFIGILVAVILIAMYLPLFQMSTNVG